MKKTVLLIIALSFICNMVGAQEKKDLEDLLGAKELLLHIGKGASTSWEENEEKINIEEWHRHSNKQIAFIDKIDMKKRTASLMLHQIRRDLKIIDIDSGITFLFTENPGGRNSLITIFPKKIKDSNKYVFVYSSHFELKEGPRAFQYYGECEIAE